MNLLNKKRKENLSYPITIPTDYSRKKNKFFCGQSFETIP